MSNVTNAPKNVEDAIFYDLQKKLKTLYNAKLNQDAPQNLHVLLKWAHEAYTANQFKENAAPDAIAEVLLYRLKQTPKSLIFDVEPDFTAEVAEEARRQEREAKKKSAERMAAENAKFMPGVRHVNETVQNNLL